MRETWRWFGEFDPIPLSDIAQAGPSGIVSALHAIPYGIVWPRGAIAERRAEIEAAGFTWDVVESLPLHEDIKRGAGDLAALFDAYRQSLINLAAEGIRTVCYNFMPMLDWTRTDLHAPLARGGTCLRFSAPKMAAFEVHMLGLAGAETRYAPETLDRGAQWYQHAPDEERRRLLHAIMSGLPGAVARYSPEALAEALSLYDGLTHEDLRANLARFLQEVVPTASRCGVRLCLHPDDPPRDILGLPRVVSTRDDIDWILAAVDDAAHGLTLCTGSLGARTDQDVVGIARAFADRVHFVHLRNVRTEPDGSFEESAHLEGDIDLVAVISELLKNEARRDVDLPYRADHGHALLSDDTLNCQPGYTLTGRLRGLAELRGMVHALRNLPNQNGLGLLQHGVHHRA